MLQVVHFRQKLDLNSSVLSQSELYDCIEIQKQIVLHKFSFIFEKLDIIQSF